MSSKVKKYFLVLFFLLSITINLQSQIKDSILETMVSNSMQLDESDSSLLINEMEYPFFDTNATQLYFYLETSPIASTSTSFIYIELKKKSNMQFKLKPEYAKRIELSSFLEFKLLDSIPLNLLRMPSGNYEFIASLMNDSSKVLHQKKSSFQFLAPSTNLRYRNSELDATTNPSNVIDFEKTFVGKYDLVTLKKNIPALEPIAKGGEIKVIKEIVKNNDIKFLKQFFYNFWYNRNPSDPEAEWKQYVEKLNYVGQKYGSTSTPGYQSDRGKIYLIYGEPDIHERVINEKGAKPYEVWFYYNAEGKSNVKFLFCQTGMIASQMFLLHSTEEEILFNPSWKLILLEDPNNKDTRLMHRVFEFFK